MALNDTKRQGFQERSREKHQTPNAKRQGNSKLQASTLQVVCLQLGSWNLKFPWSLAFGV
jgi:hypothetical protein